MMTVMDVCDVCAVKALMSAKLATALDVPEAFREHVKQIRTAALIELNHRLRGGVERPTHGTKWNDVRNERDEPLSL